MEGGVFDNIMLTMMEITLLMLVLNDFELVMDALCKGKFLLKFFSKYHPLFYYHKKKENDDLDPDFFTFTK